MLLQRFGLTLNSVLVAAGAAIALAAALSLARYVLSRALGPIFEYETLHLARKGHTFLLRAAFAIMTLALLRRENRCQFIFCLTGASGTR